MVDVPLMAALLDALEGDCRLVLVGDRISCLRGAGQPVFRPHPQPGGAHRAAHPDLPQAAQSAIVRNAHLVNAGELPDLRKNDNDFFFLSRRDPQSAAETIVDLCRRRLPENMGHPRRPDSGPCPPTRRRGTGTGVLTRSPGCPEPAG